LRGYFGGTVRSGVAPAVAFDDDFIGIVWGLAELDFFDGEGGVEAEVVAVGEKPIADGAIDPSLDAAEDVGRLPVVDIDSTRSRIDDLYGSHAERPFPHQPSHRYRGSIKERLPARCAMLKTLTFTLMHFCIAFAVAYALTGSVAVGGLVAASRIPTLQGRW